MTRYVDKKGKTIFESAREKGKLNLIRTLEEIGVSEDKSDPSRSFYEFDMTKGNREKARNYVEK